MIFIVTSECELPITKIMISYPTEEVLKRHVLGIMDFEIAKFVTCLRISPESLNNQKIKETFSSTLV